MAHNLGGGRDQSSELVGFRSGAQMWPGLRPLLLLCCTTCHIWSSGETALGHLEGSLGHLEGSLGHLEGAVSSMLLEVAACLTN